MLDQIAAAFARQDYKTAARLVQQLQQQSPDSPWVRLFTARLQEVGGQFASAEQIYRTLLRDTPHPKVALQARQGLQRLEDQNRQNRTVAPSAGMSDGIDRDAPPAQSDWIDAPTGVLVLEAVSPEARQTVAQRFAQIMRLDPYAARLLLPGRGWRLYRLGAIAELEPIGQQLVAAGIPVFWLPLTAVQRIRVFRVELLQFGDLQATAVCHSETNQKGSLRFHWSEVAGRVEARLPIFEQVVDKNARNQLVRKEQTQDYAQVMDLHLPQRNSILRFADWRYQFPSSPEVHASATSNRLKWNHLVRSIEASLPGVPLWSDFSAFGESALELLPILRDLPSHVDLFRQAPSRWDVAFQLYSGLVFAQKSKFGCGG